MGRCDLQIHDPVAVNGRLERAATMVFSKREDQRIWFSVDERHEELFSDRADPFVLAALRSAARRGQALHVRGAPTSPSLLANLEELQLAWRQWYRTQPISLESDEIAEPARSDAGAVVAFSGGLDSAYTLYRHGAERAGRRTMRLRAAVMAHGFDVPLEDADGFAGASARARRMTDSLGVELVTVRTNVRELNRPWPSFHGPALASMLTVLSAQSAAGLIASSGSYFPLVVPYGSDPISDPLLGSRSFQIRHDGAGATRTEKLQTLAAWPEAMDSLRFCWSGPRNDRNCGRCRKCVTVAVMCRSLGIRPHFFEAPVSERTVLAMVRRPPNDEHSAAYRRLALDEASRRGIDERWVRAIRWSLRWHRVQRAWSELRAESEPPVWQRHRTYRESVGRFGRRFVRRQRSRFHLPDH